MWGYLWRRQWEWRRAATSAVTATPPVNLSGNGLRIFQLNGGCGQRVQKFDRPALIMLCDLDPTCRTWESEQGFSAGMEFVAGIGVVIVAGVELTVKPPS